MPRARPWVEPYCGVRMVGRFLAVVASFGAEWSVVECRGGEVASFAVDA